MRVFGDILSFMRTSILRDVEDPQLWTDETLCECIARAHDEFAERTLILRDSSSIAASFPLRAGVEVYTLHPTVLGVLSAKVDGQPHNLIRAGSIAIDGYVPPPDTIAWLESINYGASQPGTPNVFTTDFSTVGDAAAGTVRVWPTPTEADEGVRVRMRVVRLPLVQCAIDTLEGTPECPRQFLMGLAHGGASIAYSLYGAEGTEDKRAEGQRAIFDRYIKDAERSTRRKLFAPLAWGFGRAGFTHSR